MKQFRVTFTRTLIREEVIEAASIEAARRVAEVQQKALIDADFDIEMTTYDLREADDDTGDEG
jgi:hypothetical protein